MLKDLLHLINMGTLLADLKHYLANTPKEQVDREMNELDLHLKATLQ